MQYISINKAQQIKKSHKTYGFGFKLSSVFVIFSFHDLVLLLGLFLSSGVAGMLMDF